MTTITAIYGSPRKKGNSATLLDHALQGATDAGADVKQLFVRDLEISPCLEIYKCRETGQCPIKDDFEKTLSIILDSQGLMLASPIFFYSVPSQLKALIDRCQSLWAKKQWIEKTPMNEREFVRKGLFIAVGATGGKRLFDGALLTIKYFFDVLDMEVWKTLLYRGLDFEGDVQKHPDYLQQAYDAGKALASSLDRE